jgi:hypothetical protein
MQGFEDGVMDAIPSIIPWCIQTGNVKNMRIHSDDEYVVFLLYPLSIDNSAFTMLRGTVNA